MKKESIELLLERYREGTLNDSELTELNRLTHRDEVMAAAEQRADGIIRRRRSIIFTLVGLLLAGGAVWTLLPLHDSEAPLVAEATVPEVVVSMPEPAVEQAVPAEPASTKPVPVRTTHRKMEARPITVIQPRQAVTEQAEEDPVVICNNQCEADSVISDIWKFLTV